MSKKVEALMKRRATEAQKATEVQREADDFREVGDNETSEKVECVPSLDEAKKSLEEVFGDTVDEVVEAKLEASWLVNDCECVRLKKSSNIKGGTYVRYEDLIKSLRLLGKNPNTTAK